MRILLDLQGCQSASSRHRGIGRYSMALAQALAKRAGDHELWLVLNGLFKDSIESIRQAFDELIPTGRTVVFQVPGPVAEMLPGNAWRTLSAECVREHALAELVPDIVHVSSLFEGFTDEAVTSIGAIDWPLPTVVTLYDLIPLLRQDPYLKDLSVRNWYFRKLESLKRAELILAISESSRREGVEALGLPEERVINVSSAVDDRFRLLSLSNEEAIAIRNRYGLRHPFVMYTGGIDGRKNIEGLIAAYALLPVELRNAHQLAIVCQTNDYDRAHLLALAAKFGLSGGEVILTGFVPDDDLVALYNLCSLFVFPSLHEGFGLPALEAMTCGAPTIGSNTSSIPEVIGRPDALFDPYRPQNIAILMRRALMDKAFNRSLREHAREQAVKFSWDESARRALEGFEAVYERQKASRDKSFLLTRTPKRLRLAFVSPLPPERTGIADYSVELLPILARYYDIELVTDQSKVVLPAMSIAMPVRSLDWFDAHAYEFDRILYQFGNSPFHHYMFGFLQRYPGVVVLHDFFLGHVLDWMERMGVEPHAFLRSLHASHGYTALADDMRQGRDSVIWRYPCNKQVLDRAAGVIVHSQHAIQIANQWYGVGYAQEWRQIPQLYVAPEQIERQAARARLGLSEDDFLVCSFGVMGPIKLNCRLLASWLSSKLANYTYCRLVFVGENASGVYGTELQKIIQTNPAQSRIIITGFVNSEMYRTYLAAADVAVQLRGNSRGETSRAVLDCLAYGLPLIVNGNGTMSEYPDDILIKLGDKFADADLVHVLEMLHGDAGLRQRLAHAGRAYVQEHHHPDRVGEKFHAAIEHFACDGSATRYRMLLESLVCIDSTVAEPNEADWIAVAKSIAANLEQKEKSSRGVSLPAKITWRIEGPFDSTYSLSLLNRETARALQALGHTVLLYSTEGPGDFPPNEEFLHENPELAQMFYDAHQTSIATVDVVSRNLYPPRVHDMTARLNLLHHYAWEETGFPLEWVDNFNRHLQGITCLSRHVEKILIDHGVTVPLATSGCGVDHWERIEVSSSYSVKTRTFRFLHISSCFPRKGVDRLLDAYGKAFRDTDDVVLVIKTFPNPHNEIRDQLNTLRKADDHFPGVLLIEDDLSDADLKALYQQCHALVAPSRAEGFGLPLAEAMLSGLPVITTSWGGQLDFCDDTTAWLVDYDFERAKTHFNLSDSAWAEPRIADLATKMREVFSASKEEIHARVEAGQRRLREAFQWRHVAGRLIETARECSKMPTLPLPRIGWITTWNTRCGIAVYSSHLIEQIPDEVVILAGYSERLTQSDGSNVRRCWRVGGEDNLEALSKVIDEASLDALVIQFNYGFFDFTDLSRFISEQVWKGRVLTLVLHSTSDPVNDPRKRLADLKGALSLCHRVLVHSVKDMNRLKDIGVIDNVTLFPHGMIERNSSTMAKFSPPKGRTVIASYGFFLPHKGLMELVEAVAELTKHGEDIHLNMVNAEYPIQQSAELITLVRKRITDLGIENHVNIITDYLSDEESLGWLLHSDLIVYPYQETGESSSAAVRMGLATGKPVAVTPLPIFEDVTPCVFALPGTSVAALSEGISGLLRALKDKKDVTSQVLERAERWRASHAYSLLARRLHGMLVALKRKQIDKNRLKYAEIN